MLMPNKLNHNLFNKKPWYNHQCNGKFQYTYLTVILLTCVFTAVSIFTSHLPFVYPISSVVANTTVTGLINQPSDLYSKEIPNKVKEFILNDIVNKSKAAIVVGFIDPITKTFTTLVLADMVKQGLVSLSDPIEKYLPAGVKVPQYNGTKITLEDLATHTSGLPFMPSNIWLNNTVGELNSDYNEAQLYH